jgi:hypothetical protein
VRDTHGIEKKQEATKANAMEKKKKKEKKEILVTAMKAAAIMTVKRTKNTHKREGKEHE